MHYYIRRGGRVERYSQLRKDGQPSQRINAGQAARDGAFLGLTDLLKTVFPADFLVRWAGNHGIEAGLTAGFDAGLLANRQAIDAEPDARSAYLAGARPVAVELYEAATTRQADAGTAIHDAIDAYLMGGELSGDAVHRTAQEQARHWLELHDALTGYSEHCLVFQGEIDGVRVVFGGTTDRITRLLLVDWKTVDRPRSSYPKEVAQGAGYRLAGAQMGLCDYDAEVWNVYFSRATGEIVGQYRHTETALKHGATMIAFAARAGHVTGLIEECIKREKGE
jgi:hypothetical protein